jgi:predicted nucleotidyltransferase
VSSVLDDLVDAAGGGVELSTLRDAQSSARDGIDQLRDAYADVNAQADVGLAIIGSIGRYERTQESDLDILILTEREEDDPVVEEIDRVVAERAQELGFKLSNPTGHPKFGIYKPSAISQEIGEDADTNTTMTVRMCLLLESVAVAGGPVVDSCKQLLMDTYLSKNSLRSSIPPRFLLNEVVRFWRTMAVDYEGKMRRRADRGWALRNGKLRTVRKMLYASGLLPVLECHRFTGDEILPFLADRFDMRPADRVASSFLEYDLADDGARALAAYCGFLRILNDSDERKELDSMGSGARETSPLWRRVREDSRVFHDSLTALLYDSSLGPTTREYAVL